MAQRRGRGSWAPGLQREEHMWMLIILSACFGCIMLLLQERKEVASRSFLPVLRREGGKWGRVLVLDTAGILSSNKDQIREACEPVLSAACVG